MTLKQALFKARRTENKEEVETLVKAIYRHFDVDIKLAQKIIENEANRSCGSCKWFIDEVCCNGLSYAEGEFVSLDFYCNRWEKK